MGSSRVQARLDLTFRKIPRGKRKGYSGKWGCGMRREQGTCLSRPVQTGTGRRVSSGCTGPQRDCRCMPSCQQIRSVGQLIGKPAAC